MKSMLLIGMGKFGHQLCRCLAAAGNEIMIVDTNEEKMSDLLPLVTAAKIGDCSKEDVLRSFGINDFDACVVCIFDDYLAHSLEITYQLKALGARRVIAVAGTDIHEKLLRRCGADEVIFPEREAAENISVSISNDSIFDCVKISDSFSLYEVKPLRSWLGKSIAECKIRNKYNVSIIAVKRVAGDYILPDAEYVFTENEHLMLVGEAKAVNRIVD